MRFGELLRFAVLSLKANRVRTFLTALGLVIGNASVILVVTISLTSREYILEQISGVGSNLVYAYFETGNRNAQTVAADFVKIADVEAVRSQLGPRITGASGVMNATDTIVINGQPRDMFVLGTDEHYARVRNLVQTAGRGLDATDVLLRQRVALLTERLADRLYGSQQAAIGKTIKVFGLQFTVIGAFREKTDTFGLSELSAESILIPITVLKYFAPYERVDPLYVQARQAADVEAIAAQVKQILESRHRSGARYYIGTLTPILDAARNVSLAMTIILILIAAIALVISGIGIMNIMLVTVTERTREIGVRMAVGATRSAILRQFLAEAVLISVGGGLAGVLLGISMPLAARLFLKELPIPVSWISVAVAFAVSFIVGIAFGLLPANRAARLNPTDALRWE